MQNHLQKLYDGCEQILSLSTNLVETKQNHLRNKAYEEHEDETIIVEKELPLPGTIDDIVEFMCYILNERMELSERIAVAKRFSPEPFDCRIDQNNRRRRTIDVLEQMLRVKPTKRISAGYGQKFNVEGTPVQYRYDIETETTLDFNVSKIRALVSRLKNDASAESERIELMALETKVDFESIFNPTDDLETAFEKFLANR